MRRRRCVMLRDRPLVRCMSIGRGSERRRPGEEEKEAEIDREPSDDREQPQEKRSEETPYCPTFMHAYLRWDGPIKVALPTTGSKARPSSNVQHHIVILLLSEIRRCTYIEFVELEPVLPCYHETTILFNRACLVACYHATIRGDADYSYRGPKRRRRKNDDRYSPRRRRGRRLFCDRGRYRSPTVCDGLGAHKGQQSARSLRGLSHGTPR